MDYTYEYFDKAIVAGVWPPNPDEVVITTNGKGDVVIEYLDPRKEGTYQGIIANWRADQAWQRAFNNVLAGIDEEISALVHSIIQNEVDDAIYEWSYYDAALDYNLEIKSLFTTHNG